MIDRDRRKRLIEGLTCVTLFCLLAIVLPRATAPHESGSATVRTAIDGTPLFEPQTRRRYRFRLLPLESGDQYILLA